MTDNDNRYNNGGSRRLVPARALTVAGSDSGGGAGIQADLKTFQELGVYGMSAVTAVTAQNSRGIQAAYPLPEEAVAAQLDAVLSDIGADVVKTGMLPTEGMIESLAERLALYGSPPLVVDPVMLAKDGTPLLDWKALRVLKGKLFSRALVITPNVPEACALLGWPPERIRSVRDMTDAAQELLRYGPSYVLLKGGHLEGADPEFRGACVDVLAGGGTEPVRLAAERHATKHTHGTGCTTASALAAYIALGLKTAEAAAKAKRFVTAAISEAVPLGSGIGSLWHAAHRMKETN